VPEKARKKIEKYFRELLILDSTDSYAEFFSCNNCLLKKA